MAHSIGVICKKQPIMNAPWKEKSPHLKVGWLGVDRLWRQRHRHRVDRTVPSSYVDQKRQAVMTSLNRRFPLLRYKYDIVYIRFLIHIFDVFWSDSDSFRIKFHTFNNYIVFNGRIDVKTSTFLIKANILWRYSKRSPIIVYKILYHRKSINSSESYNAKSGIPDSYYKKLMIVTSNNRTRFETYKSTLLIEVNCPTVSIWSSPCRYCP